MNPGMEKLKGEFIGSHAKILDSSNASLVGISGKIINETKNLIEIISEEGIKKIIKKQCVFEITFQDQTKVVVDGKKIAFRPEERIKKVKVR